MDIVKLFPMELMMSFQRPGYAGPRNQEMWRCSSGWRSHLTMMLSAMGFEDDGCSLILDSLEEPLVALGKS